MSDGRVVGTDVMVSSLGKGKGLPADAQQSVVADEGVVSASKWWRVNGDGGAGATAVYRNTVGDGRGWCWLLGAGVSTGMAGQYQP